MKYRILAALLLGALCAAGAAPSRIGPTTAPAATRPTTQPVSATAKEVTGSAQRTTVPADPEPDFKLTWDGLEVDDRLGEKSVIRTGFRTRVLLEMGDNSRVVIDKPTKIGITELCKVGEVTRTRLGLKYGSIRVNVERARGPSDFRVETPVAVFAVTGTKGWISISADNGFALHGDRGSWATRSGAKHRNTRGLEKVNRSFLRNIFLVRAAHRPFLGGFGLSSSERWSLFLLGGGRGIVGFEGAGHGAQVLLYPPVPCYPRSSDHNHIEIGDERMYTAR